MKKITVLMLALGLAVPAQAWHLFPVRKEIVEVQKTNYYACAVVGAIALAAGIAIGMFMFPFSKHINTEFIRSKVIAEINLKLRPFSLKYDNNIVWGIEENLLGREGDLFLIDNILEIRNLIQRKRH
ncbi:MAG: hypothetical protein LBL71_04410 [Endomicrobium sp.]|jgi:hypothetical protein|nr:hypothetical protein [Endomicrobium sp.]